MADAIYLNDWAQPNYDEKAGLDALKQDFSIGDAELEGVNILLATYEYADYSGDAYVLFEKAGNLYEVNGGHCSCYGLEGQWEPDMVTVADLRANLAASTYYAHNCRAELVAILDARESV